MARRHARTHKRTARKHSRAAKKHSRRHPRKGQKSRTMKGRKDFTTKKTSKYFNRKGHRQSRAQGSKKHRRPFRKRGGGMQPYGLVFDDKTYERPELAKLDEDQDWVWHNSAGAVNTHELG